MKQFNFSLSLIFFLVTLIACEKSQLEEQELLPEDDSGVIFLVTNLSGHTAPGNINQCGDPLTLTFELKSNVEAKEITVIADNLSLIKLKIEDGQNLSVKVRQEDGSIIAQNTAVYKEIVNTQKSGDNPAITFCDNSVNFNF